MNETLACATSRKLKHAAQVERMVAQAKARGSELAVCGSEMTVLGWEIVAR